MVQVIEQKHDSIPAAVETALKFIDVARAAGFPSYMDNAMRTATGLFERYFTDTCADIDAAKRPR